MWRRGLQAIGVLLVCGAARAASLQDSDCWDARSLFEAKGVPQDVLAKTTASGAPAGRVCGATDSCCSEPLERGLRDVVHREFRKMLLESTEQLKNLLLEQAVTVQDTILMLIHSARESTAATLSEHNQDSASLAQEPIQTLFASFGKYFQSQLSDPELEEALTVFFDDLFVVSYTDAVHRAEPALNETFASCLRRKRQELRPFRDAPFRMKEKILRTFGVAKFYLQSLYVGVEVLNTTTEFEYSESCYEALTKLSYCSVCRRLAEVQPCTGLCFNVMRGCMAPLSTLSQTWSNYVGVLQRLATSLQQSNNVKSHLFKMYMNISEAMMLVWNNRAQLQQEAMAACGPAAASSTSEPARRRRRDTPLQYRPSGDLELMLPQREQELDLQSTEEMAFTSILRNFNGDVEQHKRLFRALPDNACNEWAYHDQPECWNGDSMGDYTKPLAGVGLDSQVFNPEVDVPHMPDPVLEEKSDRLDRIRQISLDKMVAMPPTGDLRGVGDEPGWEGSGSGGWVNYDSENDFYDYYDYGSGSGEDIDDLDREEITSPRPTARTEDEGLEIIGGGDGGGGDDGISVNSGAPVVPRVKQEPAPTAPPPTKTSGAAAAAACWTLLAAALTALAAGRS